MHDHTRRDHSSWLTSASSSAAARRPSATIARQAKVVGPHFEALCREYVSRHGRAVFGEPIGEVAAGTVADPANKTQLEIDVVVHSPALPGEPRRVLSLGEATWGEVMSLRHLERLRRARDLLAAKGHHTQDTVLTCYSGAGFSDDLRSAAATDQRVLLVDLERLYATGSGR